MAPRDPRLRPALEVAHPADSPGHAADWREDRSRWLMVFGDGREHPVTARAWWSDRHGRPVVQVEYFAEMGTHGGMFLVDETRMREG